MERLKVLGPRSRVLGPLVLALTAFGRLEAGSSDPADLQGPVRAFTGARLIDGDGRVIAPRGVIVVRNGRIEAVGPEGRTTVPKDVESRNRIDLAGQTVMPGIVNAHGHVGDTSGLQSGPQFYTEANLLAQLRKYASYGVTTVVSLGGDAEAGFKLRDAQATSDGLDRARLFVAGPVITATTPEAARADVDRIAAMKPDWLKIRVDDQLGTARKMPMEAVRAVIEQGHARGLKVAVHIFYLEDAKAVLKAGADFIAHSVRDLPVDDEFIGLLKARNVCYCPTFTREVSTFVYEKEPPFFSDPFFLRGRDLAVVTQLLDPARQAQMANSPSAARYKAGLQVALANLKRLATAGVTIASGTDSGPPARFQGYFEHLELELLAAAGLTPQQVVKAATGDAARCMGLKDVGYLRAGAWADFIALKDDPLKDIKATRTLTGVWIGGRTGQP
ncbi:MAG TPA: amidohydrolase family protein [Vicinamibacterales bacterium]|nr:amidohydrolase family protein [Vicinamibacterales bacterium]